MKITHSLNPKKEISRDVEESSFLISNKKGDYLWMHGSPQSRYEGWFCRFSENLYRFIETIEVEDGGSIMEIVNGFNHIERKRENIEELFYLSESSHGFVYELNEKRKVNVFFDVREAYSSEDTPDYKFEKRGDFLIIDFGGSFFLSIRCENGENIKEIVHRHYSFDEKRGSRPFKKNVYKGVSLYGKKFVFTVAESRNKAFAEARKIFLKNVFHENEEIDNLCAKKSLSGLLVSEEGICCAGFPWFFQFWPRDAAISLKSIIDIDPEEGKKIFFRLLESGLKKGPGGAINIDAAGWTFKRIKDILPLVDTGEKEKIRRSLKKYMEELLWSFSEEKLMVNKAYQTWMDSLERSGARIEMQAMKLNMYKSAAALAKKKTEKVFYKQLEKEMKKQVKEAFYDGENLYDGYYPSKKILDKTIRPNIFIAASIPQQLRYKEELVDDVILIKNIS